MKLIQPEQRRYDAALLIAKTLGNELSVVSKPLAAVDIKNIPNSVEPDIKNWIRKYKGKSEVYGSGAMSTHSFHARKPADLDIVIDNPKHAAQSLAKIVKSKGYKTKIIPNPQYNSYVVQIQINDTFVDALDIHPIEGHYGKYELYGSSKSPLNKKGINIQKASDQLLRKARVITRIGTDGRMGAPKERELKDTTDFVATAELLLASLELKSRAQLARAREVKSAIKIWKTYLKTLKGSVSKSKPISKTRKQTFKRKAVNNPSVELDRFIFENGKIKERKIPLEKCLIGGRAISPYSAKSPYTKRSKVVASPYNKGKKAVSPYDEAHTKNQQAEIDLLLGLKTSSPTFKFGSIKVKTKYPTLKIE